jgi:DNA-nicking Smr family endonuclease
MDENEPIVIPIDGTLDLHTFPPSAIKILVPDYLEECQKNGIVHVRIVHGKGTGTLRRKVHALLARLEAVVDFRLGDESSGSWGATLVTLRAEKESAASAQQARVRRPAPAPGS